MLYWLQYSIVVDCGSSHTQFYVYKWEGDKENGTAVIDEADSCLTDGLYLLLSIYIAICN